MDEIVEARPPGRRQWLARRFAFLAPLLVLAALIAIGVGATGSDSADDSLPSVSRIVDGTADETPTPSTVSIGSSMTDEARVTTPKHTVATPTTEDASDTTVTPGPSIPPATIPGSTPDPTTPPFSPTTTTSSVASPTSTTVTVPTTPPTTTTTRPPTTTTAPNAFTQAYLGSNGTGPAAWLLQTTGALSYSALPNYDTDYDTDPGRTIVRMADGGVTVHQTQLWAFPGGEEFHAVGTPRLELWAAAVGFDHDTTNSVAVSLARCWGYLSCEDLSRATVVFDQAAFGDAFGKVSVVMPSIDVVVPTDHYFVIGVSVPSTSDSDVWIAFDSTTYPSRAFLD